MVPQSWVHKYGYPKALEMAKKAQADFVNFELTYAQNAYAKGDVAAALIHFGMAIHPLMDAYSPAHKWAVYGLSVDVSYDVAMAYVHYSIESRKPTAAEMASMRAEIQEKFACVVDQRFYDKATSRYPFVRAR
jgi:hypothetical protein